MYQKLTARIAGKPEERILSYLMLRSLKQAKYSEKNEGHFDGKLLIFAKRTQLGSVRTYMLYL